MHPTSKSHIFLHNRGSIIIIRRNEIWQIRIGGQSTNIISKGNLDGIWDNIWGIAGSFMRAGLPSMVMGGRCKAGIPNSSVKVLLKQS